MRDGQHGGCHKPRQAHDGAHSQHHPHHQQVQMVPTTFLWTQKASWLDGSSAIRQRFHFLSFFSLASSLCSLRLMMTAVICWSMKMRMVQRRAGIQAAKVVHHGLRPIGLTNHPRSSLVGYREINKVMMFQLWSFVGLSILKPWIHSVHWRMTCFGNPGKKKIHSIPGTCSAPLTSRTALQQQSQAGPLGQLWGTLQSHWSWTAPGHRKWQLSEAWVYF